MEITIRDTCVKNKTEFIVDIPALIFPFVGVFIVFGFE